MAVSFDGVNKIIELPSTGSFDAEIDLYSDWKEWVLLSDNAKFLPAFDTTGGDDIGLGQEISPYFFLRTDLGWKIKAPEQDGDVVVQGNLFPRVSGQSLFLPPTGNFTVLITQSLSAKAVTVDLEEIQRNILDVRDAMYNRSKLDLDNNTLIVYEADGTTVKSMFDLVLQNGQIVERDPQ
jgi:hypothetical protein